MIRIAQFGSYDANIGDNIALFNIRRVLNSIVEDEIKWNNLHIGVFHNHRNDIKRSKEIFKKVCENNDLLILGGGGLIEGGSFATGWKLPFNEEILENITIPVICFSLGINYFRNWQFMSPDGISNLKKLVEKSSLFSLRNDGSVDIFKKLSDQVVIETPDPGLIFDNTLQIPRRSNIEKGFLQTAWNNKPQQMVGRGFTKENLESILQTSVENNLINFPHTPKDYNFPLRPMAYQEEEFKELLKLDKFTSVIDDYKLYDYSVALRGHGQMIAIGVNLPSIYLSTQDKVKNFSYRNGFEEYNVDINESDWHKKLNYKINLLKKDEEYLNNWYNKRDRFITSSTTNFYSFCTEIGDLIK
jgi:polysaccharide pyruvyl transferase WcaK-like protein